MLNETYFEILVYTCDQDTFFKRVTSHVDKFMKTVPFPYPGTDIWRQTREDEIKRHLKPVRYNELVGCIDVHTVGSQLRADYWFTNKSKIHIGSRDKGVISYQGKLIEVWYSRSPLSSQEIFTDFRRALDDEVHRHTFLRKRFVDFETFDRCGPLVDWRSALGL